MKKFLVLTVFVALAGIPAYFTISPGGGFGVSPEHPLGDIEKIEAQLLKKDFKKKEDKAHWGVFLHVEGAEDHTFVQYRDTATSSYRGAVHRVTLMFDDGGRFRGVGGEFYTGEKEIGVTLSRTESFIRDLWHELVGENPEFRDVETGDGLQYKMYRICEFTRNGIHYRWQKRYMSHLKASSIVDFVTMVRE